MAELKRCPWCIKDPLLMQYHDTEWGRPEHRDAALFEFILLDTFQAGLSWKTVLNKRANFKTAFDQCNPKKIAKYSEGKINELLQNEGIIRNRQKINAVITNARAFIQIQQEFGSFDTFIWQFTNYQTLHQKWATPEEVPVRSAESDAMSKELIRRGFKFVGSTICYAFMQSIGMINDHLITCHRYKELKKSK